MAHKKTGGKAKQQTPRAGKRLGLKVFGDQAIKSGAIILRQRGTKFHPGDGVGMGRDHTLFALRQGIVKFRRKFGKQYVSVIGSKA